LSVSVARVVARNKYHLDGRDVVRNEPIFVQLPRRETGCLSYVVADPQTRRAAVVDPPQDLAPILSAVAAQRLHVDAVVETHTHADHLSGARRLASHAQARLVLPERSPAAFPYEKLADGGDFRVGDLRLRALATPGHTPDAMTLVLADRALVGDTLLPGTAGRADFYEGGIEEMYHSLFDRLLRLSDDLLVYPAHYGAKHGLPEKLFTTIGDERRSNEALTQATKEDFVRYMTEGWPEKPHGWREIVAANTRE